MRPEGRMGEKWFILRVTKRCVPLEAAYFILAPLFQHEKSKFMNYSNAQSAESTNPANETEIKSIA